MESRYTGPEFGTVGVTVQCPRCIDGQVAATEGGDAYEPCPLCLNGTLKLGQVCVCGLPAIYKFRYKGKQAMYCGLAKCGELIEKGL